MSRRRRWFLFTSAALVVAITLWYGRGRDRPADPWDKYDQIREGMPWDEVVALFGVPPGRYTTRPVAICATGQEESFAAVDGCSSKAVWLFDEGVFEVGFDENRNVQKKVASANMAAPPTLWDRVRLVLGL